VSGPPLQHDPGPSEASASADADAGADRRRERAATALEAALGFALRHGDALARLRARVVVEVEPVRGLREALAARQHADGGFAPFDGASRSWLGRALAAAGVAGPLGGALEGGWWLAEARGVGSEADRRLVQRLEALQGADGGFAPVSSRGGDRLAATALAAGMLARSPFARPEALEAAGAWLAQHWSPDLLEEPAPAPGGSAAPDDAAAGDVWLRTAACSLYFSNAHPDVSDEALQWCGRALEKGFRSRRREALAVVQVLSLCEIGALPGASFAPEELLDALFAEQAADGGFDALCAGTALARVEPTLDAMRALIGLCAAMGREGS